MVAGRGAAPGRGPAPRSPLLVRGSGPLPGRRSGRGGVASKYHRLLAGEREFVAAAAASGADRKVVPPAGFEPATRGLGNRCSVLLSYGGWQRTPRADLCVEAGEGRWRPRLYWWR